MSTKMKPEERMNVLFDDFAQRLSVYAYEGKVPESWRKVQLFIGESKYGFRVWVYAYKVKDPSLSVPVLYEVIATVPRPRTHPRLQEMGVQMLSASRNAFFSPKAKIESRCGGAFSFQDDASHAMDSAFDIYVAPLLFDAKIIDEQYLKDR